MPDAPDTPRKPEPGQAYRSPEGQLMLYVRTEKRPGSPAPEHLFATICKRSVFQVWLPVDAPLPEEWELIYDPNATLRAMILKHELEEMTKQRDALVAAMRRAVGSVPAGVAADIRDAYRESMHGTLKGEGF